MRFSVLDPSISILRPIPLWRRFKEFSSQRVIISANGVSLGEQRLEGNAAGFHVTVPKGVVGQSPQGLTLRFDLPDHNSPARLELSADARELALGLKTIILRRRP